MTEQSDSIAPVGAAGSMDHAASDDHTTSWSTTHAPSKTVASATPVPVVPVAATQSSSRQLQAAVQQANVHLASVNREIEFRVDASTGLTIATIKNSQTGEVLQEIPTADAVHFAQMLASWSPGKNLLVDLIA
jgi:uncharacterized FlaG/YvyC family protein